VVAYPVDEEVYSVSDTTVRISAPIHALLKQLAEAEGSTLQSVLARAVESYRRRRFLEQVNAGYAALRADAAAGQAFEAEVALWDATLADGLPAEPEETRRAEPSRSRGRARSR
jgi:predicted transcriptional regulator